MSTLKVPEEYKTINAALEVAKEYDEIVVNGGNYNEQINIGKSIIVMGINKPMIKYFPTNGKGVINFSSSGSLVNGFIIQGTPSYSNFPEGILDKNSETNKISDCEFLLIPWIGV